MSDVTKLAVVFRAAADGIASNYVHPGAEGESTEETRSREMMTMHRIARELPALGGMYFAYAGVADLFERLAQVVEQPAAASAEGSSEPEVLGYLIKGTNYEWITANEGAAKRQLGLVPNGKLTPLIAKPGA